MKATRRNFIQTLGVGAIGLTVPKTSFGDHCIDICFWFYNTDLMFTHTGGGKRPRALSSKMASSFIQFVKTGNPNGGGLPEWLPYSAEKGETMILDDLCLLQNNPDGEARKSLD